MAQSTSSYSQGLLEGDEVKEGAQLLLQLNPGQLQPVQPPNNPQILIVPQQVDILQ